MRATYITPEFSAALKRLVAEEVRRHRGEGEKSRRNAANMPGRANLWQYTLNENMGATTTSEAAADLLYMDGTDTGNDVTVLDNLDAFEGLQSGDAGYCVSQGDNFYIVSHFMTHITFTLSAAMTTSDATKSASVQSYWGGPDPGSTVTVANTRMHTASTYIFEGDSGDWGLAVKHGANFRILNMECP